LAIDGVSARAQKKSANTPAADGTVKAFKRSCDDTIGNQSATQSFDPPGTPLADLHSLAVCG